MGEVKEEPAIVLLKRERLAMHQRSKGRGTKGRSFGQDGRGGVMKGQFGWTYSSPEKVGKVQSS